MYVDRYVCICIYIYIYVYIQLCAYYIYIYIYIHTYTISYISLYIYIYIHIHVCISYFRTGPACRVPERGPRGKDGKRIASAAAVTCSKSRAED